MCSADRKGAATSSQGIRGCSSVKAVLKLTYICNKRNRVLLQIIVELCLIGVMFISYDHYDIKLRKHLYPRSEKQSVQ